MTSSEAEGTSSSMLTATIGEACVCLSVCFMLTATVDEACVCLSLGSVLFCSKCSVVGCDKEEAGFRKKHSVKVE